MAIVDFEQDPDAPLGTGNFRDDKGRQMYLTDPETASQFIKTMKGAPLRSQVASESAAIARGAMGNAAPAAQPDRRLALNDTGEPIPTGDMSMPPPPPPATSTATDANMSVAPEAAPPLTPQAAVAAVTNATAPAPAQTPAAPNATTPQKLVETIGNATGKPSAPATQPAGAGLPIAGISTTQNTNIVKGRNAKAVDAQIAAEEQAGAALDTDMLSAAERKDEAADTMLSKQMERADARAEEMRNRRIELLAQRQTALDEKKRVEDALKKNDESEDPERFMRNMSTGKSIMMAILAAINGGFGAIIGQKENGVMRVIQDKIDADIDRQKQEIASGRIRMGNQINEYMQQGHDLQTAADLARDKADAAADIFAELEAKRLGIKGENAAQAQLLVQQRREQRAQRRGELLAQKEDKVQTANSRVIQQQAPTPKTSLDEMLKKVQLESAYMKLANDRTQQQNAYELSKKAFGVNEAGEPKRLMSPEEAKDVQTKIAQVGDALTETAGAVAMSKALVEALGGRLDETTMKAIWPEDNDLKGVGPVDKAGGYLGVNPVTGAFVQAGRGLNLYRADVDKARDAQEALKQQVTSMITGANSSLKQDQTFGTMVGGDFSNEEQTKENVQNWLNTLGAVRHQHMSRLGTEGMRIMEANQLDASRGNEAPPLVPRVTTGARGTSVVPPAPNMSTEEGPAVSLAP